MPSHRAQREKSQKQSAIKIKSKLKNRRFYTVISPIEGWITFKNPWYNHPGFVSVSTWSSWLIETDNRSQCFSSSFILVDIHSSRAKHFSIHTSRSSAYTVSNGGPLTRTFSWMSLKCPKNCAVSRVMVHSTWTKIKTNKYMLVNNL